MHRGGMGDTGRKAGPRVAEDPEAKQGTCAGITQVSAGTVWNGPGKGERSGYGEGPPGPL